MFWEISKSITLFGIHSVKSLFQEAEDDAPPRFFLNIIFSKWPSETLLYPSSVIYSLKHVFSCCLAFRMSYEYNFLHVSFLIIGPRYYKCFFLIVSARFFVGLFYLSPPHCPQIRITIQLEFFGTTSFLSLEYFLYFLSDFRNLILRSSFFLFLIKKKKILIS